MLLFDRRSLQSAGLRHEGLRQTVQYWRRVKRLAFFLCLHLDGHLLSAAKRSASIASITRGLFSC